MDRGEIQMAYELFSRAVEQDPANAEAWLGKGLVAQQTTEKRICFQRVLALDPDNSVAQAELKPVVGST
jgi:Tfp pilus assembly protein PilF